MNYLVHTVRILHVSFYMGLYITLRLLLLLVLLSLLGSILVLHHLACTHVFYYCPTTLLFNNLVVLYLSTLASARNQVYSTLLLLLLLAVRSVCSLLSFCATSIYYWPGALPHSHLLSSQSISATLFCLRLPLPVVLACPF
jgi:hypothetical protein